MIVITQAKPMVSVLVEAEHFVEALAVRTL